MDKYQQQWGLNCPSCGLPRNFTTRQGYSYAINKKSICNTCSGKRKIFSESHRQKLSKSKMGSKNPMFGRVGFCGNGEHNPMFGRVGADHPAYGRKHSDDAREKLSVATAKAKKGTTHSDETKRKMRVAILKRLEKLGIPQKEDRGAKIFFDDINRMGYDFKPKRFMNIGYDADGYDEQRHIWYEFDTPYHNILSQQRKDFIRQTNIIRHFERAGRPLTAFVRTKSDGMGNIIESKCVYKDGKHTDIILGFPLNSIYL